MNYFFSGLRRMKAGVASIHLVDKCLILYMVILLAQSAYSLFFNSPLSNEAAHIDVIVRTSSAAVFGYFLSANFIRNAEPKKAVPKRVVPKKATPFPKLVSTQAASSTDDMQAIRVADAAQAIRATIDEQQAFDPPVRKTVRPTRGGPAPDEGEPEAATEETAAPLAVASITAPEPDPAAPPVATPDEETSLGRLQIIVAAGIGLFCLLVLLLLRNVPLVASRMLTSVSATATAAQMRDFVSGCVGFLLGCPTTSSKN